MMSKDEVVESEQGKAPAAVRAFERVEGSWRERDNVALQEFINIGMRQNDAFRNTVRALIKELPDRLLSKAERTRGGYREIARRCFLTHSSVSALANGTAKPRISTLAKVLNGMPDEFRDFVARLEAALPSVPAVAYMPIHQLPGGRAIQHPPDCVELSYVHQELPIRHTGIASEVLGRTYHQDLMRSLARKGVQGYYIVKEDWLAPRVQVGDYAFYNLTDHAGSHSLVLVMDQDERLSLRVVHETERGETYVTTRPDLYPDLTPADGNRVVARVVTVLPMVHYGLELREDELVRV